MDNNNNDDDGGGGGGNKSEPFACLVLPATALRTLALLGKLILTTLRFAFYSFLLFTDKETKV